MQNTGVFYADLQRGEFTEPPNAAVRGTGVQVITIRWSITATGELEVLAHPAQTQIGGTFTSIIAVCIGTTAILGFGDLAYASGAEFRGTGVPIITICSGVAGASGCRRRGAGIVDA